MNFTGNPARLPQLCFTHAGRFHADDVFSAALLRVLRPDIRIYRGFTVPKGFSGIVFDVGDGPFDHHQKNSPRRPNGTPYAAFGLLWRAYGRFFLSEGEAARFDEKFIQPLDIDDNTGTGHVLAVLIGSFNPAWDEADADEDAAFETAVQAAGQLLYHRLKALAAQERGKTAVQAALAHSENGVVVLEKYVPWKPFLVPAQKAQFVVCPSPRGGYSLQCVPRDYNGKTGNKVPLPAAWHAAPAAELQRLTGVPDVTFCHASGFMCSVGSIAGARALAAQAKEAFLREKTGREGQTRPDTGAPA